MIWKAIVIGAGIVTLAAFSVAGVFRCERGSYRLERTARIAAPPGTVQARIADLREWTTWPPWQRAGSDRGGKFEGPRSGTGASYWWTGGEETGSGRLVIVFAVPEEVRVESRLEKPRPRTSGFELRLAADGDGTLVTWTANCENDRAASLAELLTGPLPPTAADLEKGLENLKVVAEAAEEYRIALPTLEAPAALW